MSVRCIGREFNDICNGIFLTAKRLSSSVDCAIAQRGISTSASHLRRNVRSIASNFVLDGDEAEWLAEGKLDERYAEEIAIVPEKQRVAALEEGRRNKDQQRLILKNKIIERKYFRPLPAANILNCRAKAQIQYLYHTSPNKDGVETILATFPITEQALTLLLKQKRRIYKNEKDKVKHNHAVYKKWVQLAESTHLSPSLQLTINDLIESEQIDKLQNAAGVEGIPEMPTPTLEELARQFKSGPGIMTSLLVKHGGWTLRSPKTMQSLTALTEDSWDAPPEDLMQDYLKLQSANQQSLFGRIIQRFAGK
ncbi:uncharacterized protein [Watersipora subatra]|uniref:uncharacterized protein n=1 Tax=Watersipora subatra TaxID=2589382 RepID=UPI00355B567E